MGDPGFRQEDWQAPQPDVAIPEPHMELMCIKYDDDTRNWYSRSFLSLVFYTTEPVGYHCLTESFKQPYGKGISHTTSQVGN